MIRGDADVRCALFKHLDNRSQDARDRAEGRAFRWHTPQAVIVAKQLVSAVDEVNDHFQSMEQLLREIRVPFTSQNAPLTQSQRPARIRRIPAFRIRQDRRQHG